MGILTTMSNTDYSLERDKPCRAPPVHLLPPLLPLPSPPHTQLHVPMSDGVVEMGRVTDMFDVNLDT